MRMPSKWLCWVTLKSSGVSSLSLRLPQPSSTLCLELLLHSLFRRCAKTKNGRSTVVKDFGPFSWKCYFSSVGYWFYITDNGKLGLPECPKKTSTLFWTRVFVLNKTISLVKKKCKRRYSNDYNNHKMIHLLFHCLIEMKRGDCSWPL